MSPEVKALFDQIGIPDLNCGELVLLDDAKLIDYRKKLEAGRESLGGDILKGVGDSVKLDAFLAYRNREEDVWFEMARRWMEGKGVL